MLVVLARGGDGEGSGGEGGGGGKTIDFSMNHHMREGCWGVGVLDIDLPIFSPEQALKPVPLLRKANSRTTRLPFVISRMAVQCQIVGGINI